MTTSSLYPTHTDNGKVPQSSSEYQTQIQPQSQGGFPMPRKERHLLADIEYPFQHGEVINYTLDSVSIHSVTTKIQASFLTQLPERILP